MKTFVMFCLIQKQCEKNSKDIILKEFKANCKELELMIFVKLLWLVLMIKNA